VAAQDGYGRWVAGWQLRVYSTISASVAANGACWLSADGVDSDQIGKEPERQARKTSWWRQSGRLDERRG
jgi:hypothetical protein